MYGTADAGLRPVAFLVIYFLMPGAPHGEMLQPGSRPLGRVGEGLSKILVETGQHRAHANPVLSHAWLRELAS